MKITASSSLTFLASLAIGASSSLAAPTGSPSGHYNHDAPRSPDPGSAPNSPSTHSYGQLGRSVPRSPHLGGGGSDWGRSSSDSQRFRERVSRGLARYESRSVSTGAASNGDDTSADKTLTESATGLGIPALPGGSPAGIPGSLPAGLGGLPVGIPSTDGLLPGGLPSTNSLPGRFALPSTNNLPGSIPTPYGYLPNGLPVSIPSLVGLGGTIPGGLPSLSGIPTLVGGATGGVGGLAGGLTGGILPNLPSVERLTGTVGGLTGGLAGGLTSLLPPALEDTLKGLLGTLGNLPIGTILSTLGGVNSNLPHLNSLPVSPLTGYETPMGTPPLPLPLGGPQVVPQGLPSLPSLAGNGLPSIIPAGGMPSIPGGLPATGGMLPFGNLPFSLAATGDEEADGDAGEESVEPTEEEEPAREEPASEETEPSSSTTSTPANKEGGGGGGLHANIGLGSNGLVNIKDVDPSSIGDGTIPHRGDVKISPSGLLSDLFPAPTSSSSSSATASFDASSSSASATPGPNSGANIIIKVSAPTSSQGNSDSAVPEPTGGDWDRQAEKKDADGDYFGAAGIGGGGEPTPTASSVAMSRSDEVFGAEPTAARR